MSGIPNPRSLRELARRFGVSEKAVRKAETAGVFGDSVRRVHGTPVVADIVAATAAWQHSGRQLRHWRMSDVLEETVLKERKRMSIELHDSAVGAVDAIEALPLGAPFAAERDTAFEAIFCLELQAARMLFPVLVKASADAIAMFEFIGEGVNRTHYAGVFIEAHGAALDLDPAFAAFLRCELVCRRIADLVSIVVGSTSAPDTNPVALNVEATREYRRAIAQQMIGRAEFEPWASVLGQELDGLRSRLAVAMNRHESHRDAESARVAARIAERDAAVNTARKLARAERTRGIEARVAALRFLDASFSWKGLPITTTRAIEILRGMPSDEFLDVIERQLPAVQTSAQTQPSA